MAKDFDYILKLDDETEVFVEATEEVIKEATKSRLSAYAETLKEMEE